VNVTERISATLAAKYIVQIGPETTSGEMIGLLSALAVEAYEQGERNGIELGTNAAMVLHNATMKTLLGMRA
jgi:hypothetical protein